MYAYATIQPRNDNRIVLHAMDGNIRKEYASSTRLEIDRHFTLAKGIYNRVIKDYVGKPLSFELTTSVDAPPGSGLGTSSTLVVAILGAFAEWLNLPLGEYDLAHLAYEFFKLHFLPVGANH